MMYEDLAHGLWRDERGVNYLDTGAPFYDVYECADHRYLAVACLEPRFYAIFLDRLGLDPAELPEQWDPSGWPVLRERFADVLRTRDSGRVGGAFRRHRRVRVPRAEHD